MDGHRVIVGSKEWDHRQWQDQFYPDDLPEDWRLSYYANEFNGVLVPESRWRQIDTECCESWCDDVAEGFLFYLEACPELSRSKDWEWLQPAFGPHWGGWSDSSVLLLDEDTHWDLRVLRSRLEQLISSCPQAETPAVFLQGRPPDIARVRQIRLLADML